MTTRLTLDEYRTMEEANPERHEYRNGEIITTPSGSEIHSAMPKATAVSPPSPAIF
ncbi:MAG: hypothetical protein PUP92_38200 [Rhizonema sp. PD38]|nr:hypothetical protein [Rhizonema sp. PD38]